METMDAIFARRSIRKFQDRPVEPEKIELLLKAAMAAPSARNSKPWEFVVVTEPSMLEKVRGAMTFGKFNAPVAIIVCGNLSIVRRPLSGQFWVQDCSAATQNILVAAVSLGLGTVWCGVHPIHVITKRISKVLGLPEHVKPLNVIYVGYPDQDKPARTQYNAGRVHWQTY
jgi:nitroreductase